MVVRWSFLEERERLKLENYDRRIVYLKSRRKPDIHDARLENLIGKIGYKMDVFIIQLHDKYRGKP